MIFTIVDYMVYFESFFFFISMNLEISTPFGQIIAVDSLYNDSTYIDYISNS